MFSTTTTTALLSPSLYPGRTIVFVNAVSALRRLSGILTTLRVNVYPLHSEMEQRQRLKNLDRFRANNKAILLATDVAARGLDIPSVDYVVHYQAPRTSDVYIHRCGRTARAASSGFSLVLVSAEEQPNYRKIMQVRKRPLSSADAAVDAAAAATAAAAAAAALKNHKTKTFPEIVVCRRLCLGAALAHPKPKRSFNEWHTTL